MAGVLFDRLSPEPQLALALGVAAVAIAAAPAQGGLATFVIAMAIEGAGLAYIDAGKVILIFMGSIAKSYALPL